MIASAVRTAEVDTPARVSTTLRHAGALKYQEAGRGWRAVALPSRTRLDNVLLARRANVIRLECPNRLRAAAEGGTLMTGARGGETRAIELNGTVQDAQDRPSNGGEIGSGVAVGNG